MAFTVLHDSVPRLPTYEELLKLAGANGVQLVGNETKGKFTSDGNPKVEGDYEFTDLGLKGNFAAHLPFGSIVGNFNFSPQQAAVEVTHKPFFAPEALLRSKIAEGLDGFFKLLAA
jgi:hypothetical protein